MNLTSGDDALVYTPSGPNTGSVSLAGAGQTVDFSNAGLFRVNPLGGNDTVTTYGTAASDVVAVNVNTTLTVQVGAPKRSIFRRCRSRRWEFPRFRERHD